MMNAEETHLILQAQENVHAAHVSFPDTASHQIIHPHTSFSGPASPQNIDDAIALVSSLKACACRKDLYRGHKLHAHVIKWGLLQTNIFIGNTIVNMYAKCGALTKAHLVFDELLVRDLVSWNALVAGYAQHGLGMETLNCFEQMQEQGLAPDVVTFASMLKACGSIGAVAKGEEIHADIVREGLQDGAVMLGSALVDMYAKIGSLAKAQQVFDELPTRNLVSWTALIGGYCQQGDGESALSSFDQMKCEGLSPDAVTFACILKACSSIGALEKGEKIHDEIIRKGLLRDNTMLGNALVDMYAKLGVLAKAQEVFDELPVQNVVSWTALIAGYCDHGHGEEALECFKRMLDKSLSPNMVTFACILKACGSIGAVEKGIEIHAEMARKGISEEDTMPGNALIDMYAKCGALAMAQQVFDELPLRDIVSWNTLITGYCEQGRFEEALSCFDQMRHKGFSPDPVTYACSLKACGSLGAASKGKEIHSEIVRKKLLEDSCLLGNATVDMYAKCGALTKAQQVFDELHVRDVVSWTSLIAGYCEHGYGEEALKCFEQMKHEGPSPNAVTFACVLKACSSIGAVKRGQMYFKDMSTKYGLVPTLEHHTCMVVLFGRAGHFDKAMAVAKQGPCSDYLPAWFALLSACRKWENVKLGRLAFEHAIRLDKKSAIAYVCMNNIYTAAGMQEDADKVEALRIKNEAWMMDETRVFVRD